MDAASMMHVTANSRSLDEMRVYDRFRDPRTHSDLLLTDSFLLSELKLKRRRFRINSIKENVPAKLHNIHEEVFQKGFKTRKKRRQRCIPNEGEYTEGDKAE